MGPRARAGGALRALPRHRLVRALREAREGAHEGDQGHLPRMLREGNMVQAVLLADVMYYSIVFLLLTSPSTGCPL